MPKVPAKGASVVFSIDTSNILPLKPPATPRTYYVRIVVSERGRPDYVDSRSVVITYRQPSQKTTQFTEEGLRTTPKKKVAPPGDRRYSYPKIGGIHMDWCKRWSTECGQPAADEFCRREGYKRAKVIGKSSHTTAGVCSEGKCKTRIISTYQICHHPTCRAFSFIVCTHDPDCRTKAQVLETTFERCGQQKLKIVSKNGLVDIPLQGKYTKAFHSIPVTPRFAWYCGNSKEYTTCPNGTTEVDVKRYGVITDYMAERRVEITCRKVYQVCKN